MSSRTAEHRQHREALQACSLSTRAMHADDSLNRTEDVAPAMHVSTTFRFAEDPEKLKPVDQWDIWKDTENPPVDDLIYSRETTPNTNRLEAVMSSLLHGRALTYSSGLAAFHALLVMLNPKRIAIGDGYHGCHGVIGIMTKLTGLAKVDLHADDAAWDAAGLGPGDVVHVETPLNPTGEAYDLEAYAARAHARGAILTVDATFGPPGLQDPFAHGADAIMHSGTKYLGGHSDMLCGVLAVRRHDWWWRLFQERLFLGAVMGSFEGWLGLRSVRTLELRVRRQSDAAAVLVKRVHGAVAGVEVEGVAAADSEVVRRAVVKVTHASLQAPDAPWLRRQMPNGYGPVFAMSLGTSTAARHLPSKLLLFHHATSLGGVESLIEWRRMSDAGIDDRLLRVSVGVEDPEDLWRDLVQGLKAIQQLL